MGSGKGAARRVQSRRWSAGTRQWPPDPTFGTELVPDEPADNTAAAAEGSGNVSVMVGGLQLELKQKSETEWEIVGDDRGPMPDGNFHRGFREWESPLEQPEVDRRSDAWGCFKIAECLVHPNGTRITTDDVTGPSLEAIMEALALVKEATVWDADDI